MRIAILHQDLEWAELQMQASLGELGNIVELHNIAELKAIKAFDLILNRVYASVANRKSKDNFRTLELLKEFENAGIPCINSYATTLADYSKSYSAALMKEAEVPTPNTVFLEQPYTENIAKFAEEQNYPVIVKRDMGGRGKDVERIDSESEIEKIAKGLIQSAKNDDYTGGFIVQEFIRPVEKYDCRIAVIDGEFAFAYGRTLIPEKEGQIPWLASISKGSEFIEDFEAPEDAVEVAIGATKAIGALFNTVDITFGEKGPVVIENNATPNYDTRGIHRLRRASELIHAYARKYYER